MNPVYFLLSPVHLGLTPTHQPSFTLACLVFVLCLVCSPFGFDLGDSIKSLVKSIERRFRPKPFSNYPVFITALSYPAPWNSGPLLYDCGTKSPAVVFSYRLISCSPSLIHENGTQISSSRRHRHKMAFSCPNREPGTLSSTGSMMVAILMCLYSIRKQWVGIPAQLFLVWAS